MADSMKLTHVAEFPNRCILHPGQIVKENEFECEAFFDRLSILNFGDSVFHRAVLGKAEEHALGSTTGEEDRCCCKIKRINTLVT